jgi:hypothetical protein
VNRYPKPGDRNDAILWRRAEDVTTEEVAASYPSFWLVRTDGDRHGDGHTHLWPAPLLERALESRSTTVRGRVLFAALVMEPRGEG